MFHPENANRLDTERVITRPRVDRASERSAGRGVDFKGVPQGHDQSIELHVRAGRVVLAEEDDISSLHQKSVYAVKAGQNLVAGFAGRDGVWHVPVL